MECIDPNPTGVRARARAEFIGDIKATARTQLRTVGADSLSLRAVARELDVASSALYRYFPSRDDLLTALIGDAYADLAEVAEVAAASSSGRSFVDRWLVLAQAVRGWAVTHAHEYALIYGSPVPGYEAPPETTEPAQRLTLALLSLLSDAVSGGELLAHSSALPPATAEAIETIRSLASDGRAVAGGESAVELTDGTLVAGVGLWTQLFGHLSFELFGQFQNVVTDLDEFFEVQMRAAATRLTHP